MADQSRNGHFGKAKIVGNTREAMTEDVRRHIG
jgi:hypothetical protein